LVTLKIVGEDTNVAFILGEEVSLLGGGPSLHIHHREDEIFCVLEGEYEFLVVERTVRTVAGSVVYGPRNIPHTFKNVGSTLARMLAFVTPAGFEEFLEEVGEEAIYESSPPPFGQEAIERLLAVAPKYGVVKLPASG
jgi:mannose-6-phosphate isomerase-like protein (cupin superfamily)